MENNLVTQLDTSEVKLTLHSQIANFLNNLSRLTLRVNCYCPANYPKKIE